MFLFAYENLDIVLRSLQIAHLFRIKGIPVQKLLRLWLQKNLHILSKRGFILIIRTLKKKVPLDLFSQGQRMTS